MSNLKTGVNVGGLITNMLSAGFSPADCISELIDNSLDAGATNVSIAIDRENKLLYISDDGTGMTRDGLERSMVMHDRADLKNADCANPAVNGLFGVGLPVSHIVLTQAESKSAIISKSLHEDIVEMSVDWLKAVQKSNLTLCAHDITSKNEPTWNERKIQDSLSGTVQKIQCNDTIMNILRSIIRDDSDKGLLHDLRVKYAQDISEGKVLSVNIDDTVNILQSIDLLDSENIVLETIELWIDPSNGVEYPYFTNGLKQKVCLTTEPPKQTKKPKNPKQTKKPKQKKTFFQKHDDPLSTGKELIATIQLTHGYNDSMKTGGGGIVLKRLKKVVQLFKTTPKTGGDFGPSRHIADWSRCMVTYYPNPILDKLFGIQQNKSHVKWENIYESIRDVIKYRQDNYINDLIKKMKKQKAAVSLSDAAVPSAAVSSVATNVAKTDGNDEASDSSSVDSSDSEDDNDSSNSESCCCIVTPNSSIASVPTVVATLPFSTTPHSVRNAYEAQDIKIDIATNELIISDISDINYVRIITRINAYGIGSHLREMFMKKLDILDREQFIIYIIDYKKNDDRFDL
jgi:hypothetical protein